VHVPPVLRLALVAVAASRVTQSNFLAVIRSYTLPSDAGLTSYLKRSFDRCRLVHLVVDQQKKKKSHNNTFNRASINRVAARAAAVAAAVAAASAGERSQPADYREVPHLRNAKRRLGATFSAAEHRQIRNQG
jgi:hypothetical protein